MAKTTDPRQRFDAVNQQIADLEAQVNEGRMPAAAVGLQLDTLRQQRKQLKEQVQQAPVQEAEPEQPPAKEERSSRK